MPSLVTTIKNPEIIRKILEKRDFQADKVIILSKELPSGPIKEERVYKARHLEGDFYNILKEIKEVFDEIEDPYFIAGENELDIYVTYYLTQFKSEIPFFALDKGEPVLLPTSPSRGLISTKRKILEILNKRDNVTFNYIQDNLSRVYPKTKGGRRKFSETTIYQYLHELENMDLVDVEFKRNKKYSINDKGTHFMELLN